MTTDLIKTTCPRDCYDGCGIVVERENGVIRRVLGDKEHAVSRGALCAKCAWAYNGAWIDPNERLGRPLRRTGPKGSGRFEAIGWDEALGEPYPWFIQEAAYLEKGIAFKLGYLTEVEFDRMVAP